MRIGVYICHCGVNIKANVNVAKLAKFAEQLPLRSGGQGISLYVFRTRPATDKKGYRGTDLDRVVVAACSPRMHELTFRNL